VAEKHALEGVVSKRAIQVRPIPRWRKIKTTAGREMNRDRWRLFERG